MTKKQVWKQIFKYIGIGAGICFGIIGLVTGIVAIQTHGFKPKQVALSSCSFEIETDKFRGLSNDIPVFVIDEDSTFIVKPNPDDCTELDATLLIKAGDNLIKEIQVEAEDQDEPKPVDDEKDEDQDEEQDKEQTSQEKKYVAVEKVDGKYPIKLGQPFKIVLAENQSEIVATRTIELYVESESEFCEAKVFIDSKLESFDIKSQKESTFQSDYLFEGDYIYAYIDIDSVLSKSSLTMSDLVELTQDFKKFEFKIDNENVAEIVEAESGVNTTDSFPIKDYKKGFPYAKIKIKTSGNFTVTLTVCDLYSNEELILSNEDYVNTEWEDDDAKAKYDEWLESVLIKNTLEFEVSDVQIGSISTNKTSINLDLYETTRISATQLDLSVNPLDIAGSPFTSGDLSHHIQDVELACGIFVSEQDDHDIEFGSGNNTKYVKLTTNYIQTVKQQGVNEPVWVVSALEVTSSQLCLVASLTVGEDTWYDYIPLSINPIMTVELELRNEDTVVSFIDLDFDQALETQQSYTLLSNDWVVDKQTNRTLKSLIESGQYPYTKILFVVEDSEGNLSLQDDVIKIEITDTGYILTPLTKGISKVCAVVLKTDINGNLVDKENNPIVSDSAEPIKIEDVFANCQVVVSSEVIDVEVHQVLKILPNNTLTLYKQEGGNYSEIDDEDELYEVKKGSDGTVEEATIYNGQKAYIRLNVNDASAMYDAFNDTLTFNLGTDIAQADKFVKLGTSLIKATIDGEETYLLELEIFNVVDESLTEYLVVTFNGKRQCILSIKAKKFVLSSLSLQSSKENQTSEDVYLILNSQSDDFYWTVDKSSEKPLELSVDKFPSQAEGHDEIVFKIYALKDESTDISTLNTLTDEIISQYFVEDNSILEIQSGYPTYNEDDIPVVRFTVKKQGTAYVIASCVRYDDDVKIISNVFEINTKYPYLQEQTFNYGTNYEYLSSDFEYVKTTDIVVDTSKQYYTYNESTQKYSLVENINANDIESYYENEYTKYRQIVTSYKGQLTNLINFFGLETKKVDEGGEGMEGDKIGLKWKLSESDEVSWSALRNGLYKFEVLTQSGQVEFVKLVNEGSTLQYLKTNRITEKVYFKIKISTEFGYEFTQTYNYVLVPDYLISTDTSVQDNVVNMNASESKTLFKIKIDNNEIVNDGGLFFITNGNLTNYRLNNENKVTGFDGDKITIIYLPKDMKKAVAQDVLTGYIDEDVLTEFVNDTNTNIITFELGGKYYEIRFALSLSKTDPYMDVKIENGVAISKAVVEGFSPVITLNANYSLNGEKITENGIYKFTLNVSPIMQIELVENEDSQVELSNMGTSLETTFADGKQIDLTQIVKLGNIVENDATIQNPTCSLVGAYANFTLNYIKTQDTSLETNKTYYVIENNEYKKVETPVESDIANYYEKIESTLLTMSGSIIEDYNLQIKYTYNVSLTNGLTKQVEYTLNLLVKVK